jgi:hypothetical protein
MEAICPSETSVDTQRTTRRYIPEDGTLPTILISLNVLDQIHWASCWELSGIKILTVLLHMIIACENRIKLELDVSAIIKAKGFENISIKNGVL